MELSEKEKKSRTAIYPDRYRVIKRLVDILLGILLVIVLSPLFLYICILIYKKEGKPIFHKETCKERKKSSFTIWKFRTLSNPSQLITALPPYPYPSGKPSADLHKDSYRTITATGRWLKKYKLDMLPLLLNVIRGDISFIGKEDESADPPLQHRAFDRQSLELKPKHPETTDKLK
jgi:lipopolysaccharide/colanic/teichoic acid biosynthesis glycosyltransferase